MGFFHKRPHSSHISARFWSRCSTPKIRRTKRQVDRHGPTTGPGAAKFPATSPLKGVGALRRCKKVQTTRFKTRSSGKTTRKQDSQQKLFIRKIQEVGMMMFDMVFFFKEWGQSYSHIHMIYIYMIHRIHMTYMMFMYI